MSMVTKLSSATRSPTAPAGRGPVLEQVVNDALPSRYEAAIAENQLVPLGQPKLDLTKIEDGDVIELQAVVYDLL